MMNANFYPIGKSIPNPGNPIVWQMMSGGGVDIVNVFGMVVRMVVNTRLRPLLPNGCKVVFA